MVRRSKGVGLAQANELGDRAGNERRLAPKIVATFGVFSVPIEMRERVTRCGKYEPTRREVEQG